MTTTSVGRGLRTLLKELRCCYLHFLEYYNEISESFPKEICIFFVIAGRLISLCCDLRTVSRRYFSCLISNSAMVCCHCYVFHICTQLTYLHFTQKDFQQLSLSLSSNVYSNYQWHCSFNCALSMV